MKVSDCFSKTILSGSCCNSNPQTFASLSKNWSGGISDTSNFSTTKDPSGTSNGKLGFFYLGYLFHHLADVFLFECYCNLVFERPTDVTNEIEFVHALLGVTKSLIDRLPANPRFPNRSRRNQGSTSGALGNDHGIAPTLEVVEENVVVPDWLIVPLPVTSDAVSKTGMHWVIIMPTTILLDGLNSMIEQFPVRRGRRDT